MKEGLGVRGGLLEEVDLQLELEGFRKEEVISGEEVVNAPDFEAQRKRLFPLRFLAFSVEKKQPPRAKCILLSRRCYLPLKEHMLLGPSLIGPIEARTQGKPLGGKINLSLIKLEFFPCVCKKEKEGCTNFAVGSKGVRCLLSFLAT